MENIDMQHIINSATPSPEAPPEHENLGPDASLSFPAFFSRLVGLWVKYILLLGFFFFTVQLTTWLPDIDHWFIGILHHRSIITHSILLPAIVWVALPKSMSMIASVLFTAVGIHLSADVLSPSQGFGAIWLPEPFKVNLGEFSKIWLVSNAVLAFSFALKSCPEQHRYPLIGGAVPACIFYGFINENSSLAAILSVGFLTLGFFIANRFCTFPDSPIQISRQMVSQRNRAKKTAKLEKQRRKSQKGLLYFIEKIIRLPYQAFLTLRYLLRWSIKQPKTAGGIATLIIFASLWFYFLGSSTSNSFVGAVSNGAAKSVTDGVWVLHSSGGWILQQGGQYVAGTLTEAMP
jgi:hypothetical protein